MKSQHFFVAVTDDAVGECCKKKQIWTFLDKNENGFSVGKK
jgi:hypothetical protein